MESLELNFRLKWSFTIGLILKWLLRPISEKPAEVVNVFAETSAGWGTTV